MVEIKTIGPDDWGLLKAPRLAGLKDTPWAFGSTYERELEFDEQQWRVTAAEANWFVAIEDTIPIGIVNGRVWEERHWLMGMWVHEDKRGSGIANRLMQQVVTWAINDNAREIFLGVANGNARAFAFYERWGFENFEGSIYENYSWMRKALL